MRFRGVLYTAITACTFGLGAVLAKIVTSTLNPFVVTFLDMFIGGLMIVMYLLLRRRPMFPSLTKLMWGDIIQLSLLGTALPLLCIVAGLAQTSAIKGGFLLQLQGLAALIFSLFLLKEKITWKQLIGVFLLLAGSILVVLQDSSMIAWSRENLGDVLVLGGALGLGFSFIPSKRLANRVDTLQLSALRLLLGACFLLPVVFFQPWTTGAFLPWSIFGILFIYIFTNFCLGYLTLQEGVRLLYAWEVAAIMQTVPLFSTLSAILLLHDSLTFIQVVGGSISIIGGIIVTRY